MSCRRAVNCFSGAFTPLDSNWREEMLFPYCTGNRKLRPWVPLIYAKWWLCVCVNHTKGKLFILTISSDLGVFIEAPCGAALWSIPQLGNSLWKVLGVCVHTENSLIVIYGPMSKIIPVTFLHMKKIWGLVSLWHVLLGSTFCYCLRLALKGAKCCRDHYFNG